MSLDEKINAIKNLFNTVDNSIEKFKNKLNISCMEGCGQCCMKEDIEATVLEFLPAASFIVNKGDADYFYQKAENSKYCAFFNPLRQGGKCDIYNYRGLICRLFGFSGRLNKNNNIEPVTCKSLKNNFQSYKIYEIPLIHDYYLNLSTIDPYLFTPFLKINKAIQKSIEIVNLYYHYKKTG